jgi:AraC-like DNA-binding protein
MPAQSTVASIQATVLLDALAALGADVKALRAGAGLSEKDLKDPEARIPSSRFLKILERAAWQLRDPMVGLHAGARAQVRGPLFYLLLSSANLGEGLDKFARFARVTLDTSEFRISRDDGVVSLTVDPGDPRIAQSRHACDYLMGALLDGLRRAVPRFRPLGVELIHDRFGSQDEAERTFGCPVRFQAPRNVLRFSDATLRSAPAAANSAISEQVVRYTESLMSRLASDTVVESAAAVVRRLLVEGRRPDRTVVARRIQMSERTLQRRLREEGTSFKAVRDRVREETSRALLSNASLKVEAVGRSVGFAEGSSFSKAFTRWAGHSPAQFRALFARARGLRRHPGAHVRTD